VCVHSKSNRKSSTFQPHRSRGDRMTTDTPQLPWQPVTMATGPPRHRSISAYIMRQVMTRRKSAGIVQCDEALTSVEQSACPWRRLIVEEEEEEDIYLTQINNNHGNSTPIVTEPGCQKTRRSTMLATHRIQKLLTYIHKKTNTKRRVGKFEFQIIYV